jgi:hypothetical protein
MNFHEKKIDKKNLVTSLFSLYSTTWFIWQVSVGFLVIPSWNRNCHGQHGHGGVVFFTKFKKGATRQQSTEIKLNRQLAIILILRLVPRYCWLVIVLGQNENTHVWSDAQRFCSCCSMRDARARKCFLINLRAIFWRKGAPALDLENNWEMPFFHD